MRKSRVYVRDFRTVHAEEGKLRVSCTISEGNEVNTELWFEISGLPPDSSPETADAFVAPCLLFALRRSSNIRFEVPISDNLALQAYDVAHIFGIQLSLNSLIEIEFPFVVTIDRKRRGAITGFSSGVDSWFSVKKNLLDMKDGPKRITHLLVNEVGANTHRWKVDQVTERAREIARSFDLGLVLVSSNMRNFIDMNFQQTHTARNASTAHLLSSICDTFYYSSTDTYSHAGIFPTYDMAYADTILLPLLSSDAMTLRSTGSAFSRAEKTRAILDVPRIGELLDVCVNLRHKGSKVNCGYCWKCLRTEVTLEAYGALDQFEHVFDLDVYRRRRWSYIREIAWSHRPTEREAFDLALDAGLAGPRLLVRIQGIFVRLLRRMAVGRLKDIARAWFLRGHR